MNKCGLKKDWNFYNKSIHNELIFQKNSTCIKEEFLATVLMIAAVGLYFTYLFYRVFFLPNTAFNNPTSYVFIPTGTDINELLEELKPVLKFDR